jgi:hypothetical protein
LESRPDRLAEPMRLTNPAGLEEGRKLSMSSSLRRHIKTRSERDPENLQEGRYDVAKNVKLFEEANALCRTE